MVQRQLPELPIIDDIFIPCHREVDAYPSQRYEGMQVYDTVTFELKEYRDGAWHPVDPEPKGITIDDL